MALDKVFGESLGVVFAPTLESSSGLPTPPDCMDSVGGPTGVLWNYDKPWVATCPMMEDQ